MPIAVAGCIIYCDARLCKPCPSGWESACWPADARPCGQAQPITDDRTDRLRGSHQLPVHGPPQPKYLGAGNLGNPPVYTLEVWIPESRRSADELIRLSADTAVSGSGEGGHPGVVGWAAGVVGNPPENSPSGPSSSGAASRKPRSGTSRKWLQSSTSPSPASPHAASTSCTRFQGSGANHSVSGDEAPFRPENARHLSFASLRLATLLRGQTRIRGACTLHHRHNCCQPGRSCA